MRRISFSLLALAALAFTACTNEDVVLTDATNSVTDAGGDGYVSLNINLPTTPSTRAANDNFAEGDKSEYNVRNATLLLFTKASEETPDEDAVFYAAYSMSADWNVNTETTQSVTETSSTITQEITRPTGTGTDGNLYALVVLNKTGILSITNSGTDASGYFGETALTSGSTTFGTIQKASYTPDVDVIANTSTGNFYMTNAPLYTEPGDSEDPTTEDDAEVKTLVEIPSTSIHPTIAESQEDIAAYIYVERGVAKVTVENNISFDSDEDNVFGYVGVEGFALDQTNTKMYPVRYSTSDDDWWGYASSSDDVSSGHEYRFVGGAYVGNSKSGLYRTYWATDPNYDAAPTSGDLTELAGSAPTVGDGLTKISDGSNQVPLYCLENTFNVANMKKDRTTRVIIAVSLNKNGEGEPTSFFTVDDNSTICTESMVEDVIRDEIVGITDVHSALAKFNGTEDEFVAKIGITGLSTDELEDQESADDLEFTVSFSDFSATDFSDYDDSGTPSSAAYEALTGSTDDINDAINDAIKVSYYKDGVAYYPILIKHFGDDLTPWDETNYDSTTGTSYPNTASSSEGSGTDNSNDESVSSEKEWLGRYGVLRNNWYDIDVTGITKVGYPIVPEGVDEDDDPVENYISVEVKVLSWAKRTQEVTL